jgi:hypothetical protein
MADHQSYPLPPKFDFRDVDFRRNWSLWAAQTEREMLELIIATKETIKDSRALLAEADRLFSLK